MTNQRCNDDPASGATLLGNLIAAVVVLSISACGSLNDDTSNPVDTAPVTTQHLAEPDGGTVASIETSVLSPVTCDPDVLLDDYDVDVLVAYPVDLEPGEVCLGTDTALGEAMWRRFESVVPVNARSQIDYFVVYEATRDEGLDGFVLPATADGSGWVFAINGRTEFPEELDITIAHEFAHVLSLNDEEIDHGAPTCDVYDSGEGCAHEDSMLAAFVDEFWLDKLDTLFDLEDEGEDPQYPICDAAPADFYRAYNATNPGEDLAEMFAVFALDLPTQSPTVEAKKTFFEKYPAAVAIRDHILASGVQPPNPGVLGDCE